MTKNSTKKKRKKKFQKNRRISRKIKFIRHSCSNSKNENNKKIPKVPDLFKSNNSPSEKKYILVFTMINLVHSFLRQSSFPEKGNKDFRKNFISIINDLSMNENEYIIWTLLIENNYNKIIVNDKIELETLFYLGMVAKEKLNPDFLIQINQKINNDKFEDLNIDLKELNNKLNHYKSLFTTENKKYIIDYEKMTKDINEIDKEKKNKNQQNRNFNGIQNQTIKFPDIEREDLYENDNTLNNHQENLIFYIDPVNGISHDNDALPLGESYSDCYKDINSKNIFYLRQ